MSSGSLITRDAWDGGAARPAPPSEAAADSMDPPSDGSLSLREQVEAFERNLITAALTRSKGNQSEAARRLGASRATLIDKIKKYGLASVGVDPP